MLPQSSIEIEIHTHEACVITLYGEHDTATSDGVTLALALARDYTYLLADLTPCTFLDGTVINALLSAAKRMRAAGAHLEVAVRRPSIAHRTLELCGVLQLIPTHESRAAGVAAITTAERLASHPRPVSLKAVSAEIDHFNTTTGANCAHPGAGMRGITVLRAHVADATNDRLGGGVKREKRRAA